MKNLTLINATREILKDVLTKCSTEEHLVFKRMYANGNLDMDIYDVVDLMEPDKLDWAITQAERTVFKKIRHA